MSGVLVDSNVLLDIILQDEEWLDWSSSALDRAAASGHLVINPIIYAEVSAGYDRIEDLDEAVPPLYVERRALPWRRRFSRANVLYATDDPAGPDDRRCRISISAHTPQSKGLRF